MSNGTVDFILGQIEAKLDLNEVAHKEIKETLSQVFAKADLTNKTIQDMCGEIGALKAKASVWGGVVGFIVSAVMGLASWLALHFQK